MCLCTRKIIAHKNECGCQFVHVHVCVWTCVWVYAWVCVWIFVSLTKCVCVFGCLCVCRGGYMYASMYVCMHTQVLREKAWRQLRTDVGLKRVKCGPARVGREGGKGGTKSAVPHKWANWFLHPCHRASPPPTAASKRGTKSVVAHRWENCCLGGPQCFKAMEKISSESQLGRLATSPVSSTGSPML